MPEIHPKTMKHKSDIPSPVAAGADQGAVGGAVVGAAVSAPSVVPPCICRCWRYLVGSVSNRLMDPLTKTKGWNSEMEVGKMMFLFKGQNLRVHDSFRKSMKQNILTTVIADVQNSNYMVSLMKHGSDQNVSRYWSPWLAYFLARVLIQTKSLAWIPSTLQRFNAKNPRGL